MRPPILFDNPNWDNRSETQILDFPKSRRLSDPVGFVVRHYDDTYSVHWMRFNLLLLLRCKGEGWQEWRGLDLFAAQAVVDHIYTTSWDKFWHRLLERMALC